VANYLAPVTYQNGGSPSLTTSWILVGVLGGQLRGDIQFQNQGTSDPFLCPMPTNTTPALSPGVGIKLAGNQTPPATLDYPGSADYWFASSGSTTGNSLAVTEQI
jgi:hypothetical protein